MDEYIFLCKKTKIIHDVIHGYINLSNFAIAIIDTKYFQRLRKLHQLGSCYFVYPNATHTRFEHSLGTYHVADELLNTITATYNHTQSSEYLQSINELKSYYKKIGNTDYQLDNYICELIKIAALCHDIGHGPFSHVFDDEFIPLTNKYKQYCSTHEERSGIILETIIKENPQLNKIVSDDEIIFMKNLINPSNMHNGFIYQIVSNTLNGLDVDKFDYLPRDIYNLNFQAKIDISRLIKHIKIINNNIVYSDQSVDDIYNLYQTRYRLHKQVYCHKAVISSQFVITELLLLLNDILKISDSISDMNLFCKLTDEYIFESIKILDKFIFGIDENNLIKINKAKNLVEMLETRKLYPMIFIMSSKEKININELIENLSDKNDILVFQHKVGFVSGNKPNPFDSIYVYKTKDCTKIFSTIEQYISYKKEKDQICPLMSNSYQEYITIIYYKYKDNKYKIDELKKYFSKFTFMN